MYTEVKRRLLAKIPIYRLLCAIFIIFRLYSVEGDYRFETVFPNYDDTEKKFELLAFFLPFNPTIVAHTQNPQAKETCHFWWPKGEFHTADDHQGHQCDLLWIDSDGDELDILYENKELLGSATALYTTTHFYMGYYENLKLFLYNMGFTLLGHWYREGQSGRAMFVKADLLHAALKSLNYMPSHLVVSSQPQHNIDQYLRKVDDKLAQHRMENIDFIYMINLDERPEKYALSYQELAPYGIYPYRFSAVNGWKLPSAALRDLGVKFTSDFQGEQFLGSVYKEIEGKEYLGNEIMRPGDETFFLLGMSRGAIGIILSHLSILQDAYNAGYKTIWIMEDDIEAVDDPRQLPHLIQKLDALVNDWDILFTDTDTKDTAGNHVPCRAVSVRPNFPLPPLSSFFQHFYQVSDEFSRIGMRYGAYSMIVRRSGMEKILNHFKTYGIFIPYDMDLWLNPEVKMYSVNKDIVSHRAGAPTDNSEPHYLKKQEP